MTSCSNPNGRPNSNFSPNKWVFCLNQSFNIRTLNCRFLNSEFIQVELNLQIKQHKPQAVCIKEHRLFHKDSDLNIISHDICHSMFTVSVYKSSNNVIMGDVGIMVRKQILPLLTSIKKIDNRVIIAFFKGNLKTVLLSCYSFHKLAPLEEVEKFHKQLGNLTSTIPSHNGGDFNARISGKL